MSTINNSRELRYFHGDDVQYVVMSCWFIVDLTGAVWEGELSTELLPPEDLTAGTSYSAYS